MRPWFAASAALFIAVAALPAQADEVVHSMSAVQSCLCARQLLSVRDGEVRAENQRYEASKRESESLSKTVEDARPHINTDNRADIESFTALLAKRDQAVAAFNEESARYATVVQRYNEAVNGNNAMCVGRLFDIEQMEAAKNNLACPR